MKKIINFQKLKEEYYDIYSEFNKIDKYRELSASVHHGISRKDHIHRVGFISFLISKLFKLDAISTTRGALLHDFFTDNDVSEYSKRWWHKMHPYLALNNSLNYFELNDKEKNIIQSHMFPLTFELPKYKESVIVGIVDKLVSIYEFSRFNVKAYAYFVLLFISTR